MLNHYEQFYINYFGTKFPNGYNGSNGGEGVSGVKFTEEHKKRISDSHKGKVFSEEHKRKLSKAKLGKKLSDEHKNKLRKTSTGRIQTPESIAKQKATKFKNGPVIMTESTKSQIVASRKNTYENFTVEHRIVNDYRIKVPNRRGTLRMIDIQCPNCSSIKMQHWGKKRIISVCFVCMKGD
jgi:hypothetical protein